MSIVTKQGDQGETCVIGARKNKNHTQLHAIGAIDELNSGLGMLIAHTEEPLAHELEHIQRVCFCLGSICAAAYAPEKQTTLPRVEAKDVAHLEAYIAATEPTLPELHGFILPGGTTASSCAFWVRALARKAERNVVALARRTVLDALAIQYLNRLSDYLFIVARKLNHDAGITEHHWRDTTTETIHAP